MKAACLLALCTALALPVLGAADPAYVKDVEAWRARADASLRKDNGWLTLAGRYVMKEGANSFGTGADNDIVFPKGLGPARMGTISVAPGRVEVKLAPGLTMEKDGIPMNDKVMDTEAGTPDWVSMGRAAFHVIEHQGRYVLRLADNRSENRARFGGRTWYPVKEAYRVRAKFVAYEPRRHIPIVNVIDEVSDEPSPGYVQFELGGKTYRLDAVGDDGGLFFVFRDATAGKTTYGAGRFLYVAKKPASGQSVLLDFNRAYNPPCAFNKYTTCPLPPKQNVLPVRVEAGEKYPPRRTG
ncbi:MAG TPA: DUF1684 domain-containing protein [Usitatibacter sp.]|nr:DUF1684 domain-containing protein [Usitatibacter sp.]